MIFAVIAQAIPQATSPIPIEFSTSEASYALSFTNNRAGKAVAFSMMSSQNLIASDNNNLYTYGAVLVVGTAKCFVPLDLTFKTITFNPLPASGQLWFYRQSESQIGGGTSGASKLGPKLAFRVGIDILDQTDPNRYLVSTNLYDTDGYTDISSFGSLQLCQ